jgi:thioredoxin-related protein
MKRMTLILILLIPFTVMAQTGTGPYTKTKNFPPINLLLPDSSTIYTKADLPKDKSVLLMIFSPTCDHCKHETGEMLQHMDEFSKTHILMVTSMPFDSMLSFRDHYQLQKYPNITVAHDPHFFLIPYYNLSNMPFLAFYNKKKQLISVHEGSWPIENVIAELKK